MDWTSVTQTALRNNHLFCIRNYISEFLADGKWFIYIYIYQDYPFIVETN